MRGVCSLRLLAIVMSAVVHDFEHPGVTNYYAVHCGLEQAKIFNDQAVSQTDQSRT